MSNIIKLENIQELILEIIGEKVIIDAMLPNYIGWGQKELMELLKTIRISFLPITPAGRASMKN